MHHIASVGHTGRRAAIRQTWMAAAPSNVVIKFVLYEKEQNIDITKESAVHQDIIFVPGGNTTDYRSIVFKTFAFVQVDMHHASCITTGCTAVLFDLQIRVPFAQ